VKRRISAEVSSAALAALATCERQLLDAKLNDKALSAIQHNLDNAKRLIVLRCSHTWANGRSALQERECRGCEETVQKALGRCVHTTTEKPHECPFASEIHSSAELCLCCANCEASCAADI
jgi:hypothetical protein